MNDKLTQKRKQRLTHILSDEDIRKNVAELRGIGSKEKEIILAFSERLNKLLEKSEISQEAFATLIGGSPAAVSKYRSGKGMPKSSVLLRMAQALSVSTDYLLGLSDLRSLSDDSRTVHKVTGLSDDAIDSLRGHKTSADLEPFASPRLSAINYLLEQDLEPIEYSGPESELYEYEKWLDLWNENHLRILSDIADYLSIRASNSSRHSITYDGIKQLKDSKGDLIQSIETKALAVDDEIVDSILIDRITEKLKKMKKNYQNTVN